MSVTERLYYNDSRLLEFDARVTGVNQRDDGAVAITLDRTAFYPTGGGQPSDTGTLGEARVNDCIDAEDEGVLHVIRGPVPDVDDTVHGQVDWLRRLDHMQQHTGQHILSAAFVRLFAAPTHSFRVLEHECEIDVALDDPTDERIEPAVDLANQIIWECRPIQVRQVTTQEAARLPLRKESAREGDAVVVRQTTWRLMGERCEAAPAAPSRRPPARAAAWRGSTSSAGAAPRGGARGRARPGARAWRMPARRPGGNSRP